MSIDKRFQTKNAKPKSRVFPDPPPQINSNQESKSKLPPTGSSRPSVIASAGHDILMKVSV